MRIQTFFLCSSIFKNPRNNAWEGTALGAHSFFPVDSDYPFSFKIPFYLLLVRDAKEKELDFVLTFNLFNKNGKQVGHPNNVISEGHFPKGNRFLQYSGTIQFEIPGKGDYSLEIKINDTVYNYDFECEAPVKK